MADVGGASEVEPVRDGIVRERVSDPGALVEVWEYRDESGTVIARVRQTDPGRRDPPDDLTAAFAALEARVTALERGRG